MHRRFPMMVLIFVVVAGLLIVGGQSGQQNAWTQGYLTGLAAAGGQDGGALPYALAMQNQRTGPSAFGLIIGFGMLMLVFMAFGRGFKRRMMRMADGSSGEDWMRHWQRHGPWRGCGPEKAETQVSQEEPTARQPMPAEPVETMQTTTTQ